jgi:F-type H+-transporting ATPase subunit b
MEIDWLTLSAQIVNFLILVVILRYVLYHRIIGAIDGRREEIEEREAEVARRREEAEREAERHRREREALAAEREERLAEAREEADAWRERWLDEAREEVERERETWRQGLERERDRLFGEIRDHAGAATYGAVHRALADLADEELEAHVARTFARKLRGSGGNEEIREALRNADEVVVRSAFELRDDGRERIRDALAEAFDLQAEPRFEVAPDLVLGILLEAGGRVIDWSVSEFMDSLESRVKEQLEAAGVRAA